MVSLNDYLYCGDTILSILNQYAAALRSSFLQTGNEVDQIHSSYVLQQLEILEHREFLPEQALRIREFYQFVVDEFPYFAFTFKGRIKSAIRAEEKFNGVLIQNAARFYQTNGYAPPDYHFRDLLSYFKDLIAYRIVVSIPANRIPDQKQRSEAEIAYLYELAEQLPSFLMHRGFTPEPSPSETLQPSHRLSDSVAGYYRDFIEYPTPSGYQSLHINFYDNRSRCHIEFQLRTKLMDDYAEIGPANHAIYESQQTHDRFLFNVIPAGECLPFDEACERMRLIKDLDLSKLQVNMFSAFSPHLINDGCGLLRGRLILPYEHLSRFQRN